MGKIEEKMGVNPNAFFLRLKLLGQSDSHHATGNRVVLFRSLQRLYQILIDDLQFYILRSRPCRALEKVSKNRGFKNINLGDANNSICKGPA